MADWIPKALVTLMELSQLEKDWDSFGGNPPKPKALGWAVGLLGAVAKGRCKVPEPIAIVPCSSGAIQLEWDEPEVEVELAPQDDKKAVAHCLFRDEEIVQLSIGGLEHWLNRTFGDG